MHLMEKHIKKLLDKEQGKRGRRRLKASFKPRLRRLDDHGEHHDEEEEYNPGVRTNSMLEWQLTYRLRTEKELAEIEAALAS